MTFPNSNEQTRLWASANFMFNGSLGVASVGSAVFVSSRRLLLLPQVIKTIKINTFFKYGLKAADKHQPGGLSELFDMKLLKWTHKPPQGLSSTLKAVHPQYISPNNLV